MNLQKQILLVIIFTVGASIANAKNYYFSASIGNDTYTSAQAQNPATPWKTLAKVNSFFANFVAGDSILFKSGEVFDGNIVVSKSGTVALPIIFASYGTGAKPIINGFSTLSSWTSLGGGIYQSNCAACGVSVNTVAVNGVQRGIGRYPNTGYLTYQSHVGTVSITDASLPTLPNWTGAEVVIRKSHWIIDRNPIISQAAGVIVYTPSSTYAATDNYGYFIQNDARTLDQFGEWYFNPITKNMQMFFGTEDPNTYSVKAGVVTDIVYINKSNNITFLNLSFIGANVNAFNIGAAAQISILNCNIDLSGTNAIVGQNTGISSTNFRLENTTINHTNNIAVFLPSEFTSASIKNNLIKNSGLVIGMGGSGDNTCEGIIVDGNNTVVQYNVLDSVGYTGIGFYGTSISIKNNLVNHFCMVKDDGGGIYTFKNLGDAAQTGSEVNGNIVLNGISSLAGLNSVAISAAEGIYCDGYSSGVSIINNTISNCGNAGLYINSNTGGVIRNNQFYNNKIQAYFNNPNSDGTPYKNLAMYHNVFFPRNTAQLALNYRSPFNNIDPTFNADSNLYVVPYDNRAIITTSYSNSGSNFWGGYNLTNWQSAYNVDKNGVQPAINVPSYTINSLVGANKYTYGTYEGRTDLPFVSPANTSYDNTSKIDGVGSLKVSYSGTSTDNLANVNISGLGAVDTTLNYILRFSTVASTQNRVIGVCLSQTVAPFATLTPIQFITIPAGRKDYEVLFSFPSSSPTSKIIFQLNSLDGTIWFDNIQFYQANVTLNSPDNYTLFQYNASASAKVVPLSKPYIDVNSNYYTNNITIKPYTSVLLIDAQAGCSCPKQVIQWKQ